nr:low affinity iron permease family protein [Caulobacter hibisci]
MFARFASATAKATGSPVAFLLCVAAVLAWAITGPIFKFSETWQLVINTGTTIVTFLMVFLIQNTQNRDGLALQAKLDELIRASDALDEFMGIEKLTDKELEALHARCQKDAERSVKIAARAQAERKSRQDPKAAGTKVGAAEPRLRLAPARADANDSS